MTPEAMERAKVVQFLTLRANSLRDCLPYDDSGQAWATMGELRNLVKRIERGDHMENDNGTQA